MKPTFQIIIILSLLMVGCSTATTENPKIVNYPQPEFIQDQDALAIKNAGCVYDASTNGWNCQPDAQLGSMGCKTIWTFDQVGSFAPLFIWGCYRYDDVVSDQFILKTDCGDNHLYSMGIVLFQDGKYQLLNLKSIDDLKNAFAPIDSGDKALSYILIANNFYSMLDNLAPQFTIDQADLSQPVTFHVTEFDGTHAEKTDDGYIVNLYTANSCCADQDIYAENILVTTVGDIKIIDKKLVFTFNEAPCVP
jgi:hypothetical protein